jgi:hypothetical protein
MSFPSHNPFKRLRSALTGEGSMPLPFTASLDTFEPEVPESEREAVAWANAGGRPGEVGLRDQDGRLMDWHEYGQLNQRGWHVHQIIDGAIGGRFTRSNIIARHWRGNTDDSGSLGAILRRFSTLRYW